MGLKAQTSSRSHLVPALATSIQPLAIVAMKSMKAMKAMKAMKTMKAKKVGRKSLVFAGTRVKTTGGLKKQDLTMNKRGKVVSKKMHANGKKAFSHIKAWHVAVTKARQALGVNGFVAIGCKKPEGKALYAKAKAILEGK